MKLIEEFKYILWEDCDATGDEIENACKKITECFTIKFAEWLLKECYQVYDGYVHHDTETQCTLVELLEIYKKESGL